MQKVIKVIKSNGDGVRAVGGYLTDDGLAIVWKEGSKWVLTDLGTSLHLFYTKTMAETLEAYEMNEAVIEGLRESKEWKRKRAMWKKTKERKTL